MTRARPVSSTRDTIFSDNLSENFARTVRIGRSNAEEEARNDQETEDSDDVRFPGRPAKPEVKLPTSRRHAVGKIARKHAEVDAALAEARKSHERLREAIDILPQGVVFLDAEGRYILWNKKYAEMYRRSADLFKPGARLEDTLRTTSRGDYPEAIGSRGRMDRRAAREAVPARRADAADAGRRPRHPDR